MADASGVWPCNSTPYARANQLGVGDFTDLARLVEWAGRELGAGIVGLNPLHALKNSRPHHLSPYSHESPVFE